MLCLLISFWFRHHRLSTHGSDTVDHPKDIYNPPEMQAMLANPDLPQYSAAPPVVADTGDPIALVQTFRLNRYPRL
jgi:hypothetical protein